MTANHGHINLEASSSPEVNNFQRNESSANNAFSEETSLEQTKKESGLENIRCSHQTNVTRSGVIQSPKIASPVDAWISDMIEF